ncbi:MAG: hypothetical protein HYX97_02650 [Chloroflexi bacterium]|nr:hypothetical protein [Chloroflexota bacterium]
MKPSKTTKGKSPFKGPAKPPPAAIDPKLDRAMRALPGAATKRMFGMDCYVVGGKVFAGWWHDGLVLKLSGTAFAQAMAVPGAHAFDPMGGRPMKEWVVVPANSPGLTTLIKAAHGYAGGKGR